MSESIKVKKGYKQTEIGVIPEDWEILELEDAVEFLDNFRKPINYTERLKMQGIYPYYGASGIVDWVNDYLFDENLILLAEDGENILSRNLPISIKVNGKIWVNNHAHVLRAKHTHNNEFLTYFLESIDYSFLNSGTAQPKLNKHTCKKIRIFSPPLPEQKAIAQVLSDTDDLITSLDKLIEKKKAIKQGTMEDLLSGRRRLPGFETNKGYKQTEVGTIPEDWDVVKLGDIGEFLIGLTYRPEDVVEYGTLVLRSANIQKNKIELKNNVFVEMNLPKRVYVRNNDLLICVRNGSRDLIGKCALITENIVGVVFGAFMSIFRSPFNTFCFFAFQSNYMQKEINETVGATINQLTNKDLVSFKIPLPPLSEQKAIARVLSDMDAEIEALEAKRAKYMQIKQGMMEQLLTGKVRLV